MKDDLEAKLEQAPVQKKATWITLRLILAVVLFLVTLFLFVAIADEMVLEKENNFDLTILKQIDLLVSPARTQLMKAITFFGSANFLFPAYAVLIIYFIMRKRGRLALDIGMVGLSSTGILFLFKDIFKRPRPLDPLIQQVSGFSFPSGHSFSSFTFFGIFIYIFWQSNLKKRWKILIAIVLFIFATIIAFSRVYLRVHFPSDVVAGFCLSLIWLMISLWILHKADRGIVSSQKK
jgi:membrane-associated phospholipid phosphatase